MVDVVNEPIASHNPPDGANGRANYKAALGGNGVTGWDWVIKAFELARIYLPNTKLLLNDYGIINDNSSTTTYLTIINLLKDRGLIDGIGVQGHRFELENANTSTLKSNLDRLAATGLPVYISEFDLGNINNAGTPDDAQQLQLYQKIFPVLWKHPGVKGITLWGYLEGEMWQSSCYLVLKDGTWRPAMTWLAQYIKDTPLAIEDRISSSNSDELFVQNFPNPFSGSTQIQFRISKPEQVSLKVYTIQGQEVTNLIAERLEAGLHKVTWVAKDKAGIKLSNNIYICRLVIGNKSITRKMLLEE
jgi:endo-1,4-beta-xylanase